MRRAPMPDAGPGPRCHNAAMPRCRALIDRRLGCRFDHRIVNRSRSDGRSDGRCDHRSSIIDPIRRIPSHRPQRRSNPQHAPQDVARRGHKPQGRRGVAVRTGPAADPSVHQRALRWAWEQGRGCAFAGKEHLLGCRRVRWRRFVGSF